ncbi:phosphatidylserine/phosphatidylglycerophosphate/cardiolipin synthase family protein [Streptomyces sp. AJS327]|uniref:phosphatidylserine/phosphatidylglycerophosphate/ cardiolipin synthase family protein n=1 Tax=Streptomyces sp. AJS327 TaxID=2545265 RepID=UPI0015DD9064|nr:phosphatidylserine/phosphatidylglycerophosphate/cardiolipin synthase family protein [Streptomyces sp. AJS327]MBA0053442.1 phosphatidylserine/phosphatidylglycerophosphate/cardiolipin synthase family protein [Streptomyces sp. AJS327]
MNKDGLELPATFDQEFVRQDGHRGHFGKNVLKGLVDGMEDFLEEKRRTPGFRSMGPVALGGFLWLDDPEVAACLARFAHTCVVVSKQGRSKRELQKLSELQPFADGDNGMPARVFAELTNLDWREEGRAKVVGPTAQMPEVMIPPLRTIGFRRQPKKDMVPFLHTKIMLLGELWWHDEDALGGVADVIGFRPERLWVGSANATARSRYNLEFGMWLDDPKALQAAQTFLVQLMAHSEALDPDSDLFEPELLPVDFDDEAFAEYAAEYGWGEHDDA